MFVVEVVLSPVGVFMNKPVHEADVVSLVHSRGVELSHGADIQNTAEAAGRAGERLEHQNIYELDMQH